MRSALRKKGQRSRGQVMTTSRAKTLKIEKGIYHLVWVHLESTRRTEIR